MMFRVDERRYNGDRRMSDRVDVRDEFDEVLIDREESVVAAAVNDESVVLLDQL